MSAFRSVLTKLKGKAFSTASLAKLKGKRAFSSTATSNDAPEKYSFAMQVLHWTMGGAALGCVGTVLYKQSLPKTAGKQKGQLMFIHKSLGTLSALLLAPRLAVRLVTKVPNHVPGAAWEVLAGKISHFSLYGFLIAMPVTGVAMGYFGGKGLPLFFTTIPGAEKKNGAIAKQAFSWHKTIGTYGKYLIPVHVGAVGVHLAKGSNILPRMVGFMKPVSKIKGPK
jgi:superoxide oxidase